MPFSRRAGRARASDAPTRSLGDPSWPSSTIEVRFQSPQDEITLHRAIASPAGAEEHPFEPLCGAPGELQLDTGRYQLDGRT